MQSPFSLSGPTLDDIEWAKALHNVKVQIGDVDGGKNVGQVPLTAVDKGYHYGNVMRSGLRCREEILDR